MAGLSAASSLSIPYHLAGLDSQAASYVTTSLAKLRSINGSYQVTTTQEAIPEEVVNERHKTQVRLRAIEVWVDHELSLSAFVRLAMDSFGIESETAHEAAWRLTLSWPLATFFLLQAQVVRGSPSF